MKRIIAVGALCCFYIAIMGAACLWLDFCPNYLARFDVKPLALKE